jgi:hypothetical protein
VSGESSLDRAAVGYDGQDVTSKEHLIRNDLVVVGDELALLVVVTTSM